MIWRRYLFLRLLKTFFFFLCSIFILFVFIDLATRSGKVFLIGKSKAGPGTLLYYLCQFSSYLHFFFPLSFILASIQVLLDLNKHQELVALQMGGLSPKKLLSPFFFLASFLCLFLLANQEWVAPKALSSAHEYTKMYARHKKKPAREHLQTIYLKDGSEIVFQCFLPEKKELFDVFWLQNSTTVWYMKFFELNSSQGRFVDLFEKNKGEWKRIDRFESLKIPELILEEKEAISFFVPYERRSLSKLALGAFLSKVERPKLLSHLFYKLSTPLLLFFFLSALAPICLSFSRNRSGFAILAVFLFVFLATMMLFDALLVLGENQVFDPNFVFGIPLFALFGYCYRTFQKVYV